MARRNKRMKTYRIRYRWHTANTNVYWSMSIDTYVLIYDHKYKIDILLYNEYAKTCPSQAEWQANWFNSPLFIKLSQWFLSAKWLVTSTRQLKSSTRNDHRRSWSRIVWINNGTSDWSSSLEKYIGGYMLKQVSSVILSYRDFIHTSPRTCAQDRKGIAWIVYIELIVRHPIRVFI